MVTTSKMCDHEEGEEGKRQSGGSAQYVPVDTDVDRHDDLKKYWVRGDWDDGEEEGKERAKGGAQYLLALSGRGEEGLAVRRWSRAGQSSAQWIR